MTLQIDEFFASQPCYLALTVSQATREDSFETILYSSRPAFFTDTAGTVGRAIRRTLPNLIVLHIFPDLDDHPRTFMAGALHSQVAHLGEFPMIHHEMHISQAESSDA